MKQITTFSNSFVLQEVDGSRVINELGFRKGGLSYKIMNNNVKFYLTEDYFYKNVIWSADIPLTVDGISYDVNALPTALKKIFIQEKGSGGTDIDIDHALNPMSDNPVANSTLTPIIREIQSGQSTLADAVSGKADTSAVTAAIDAATSGKVETSTFNTYTAFTADAIAAKFDDVDYDSQSKRINFYSGGKTTGTIKAYIDATDFIKDGMVDNVEVKTIQSGGTDVTVLAITFNADSGKQEIDIPISQIFDASNYFTTAQTQAYVTGYTYDKATIDQKVAEGGTFDPTLYYDKTATDNLLANKADTATTYTKTEVDNAITAATSTKQDTLVSGTNIKTVGAQSVLGSGNIALMTAHVGTGNDAETLIFDFA